MKMKQIKPNMKHLTTLAALWVGLLAPPLVSAQIIQNGSFETPDEGGGSEYQPYTDSWNFTPFSGITGLSPGWGSPVAPDGVQVAMLQSSEGFNSEISQIVSNFTIGARYVVTFSAAQRVLSPPHTNQDFNVLVDDTFLGHFAANGWSFENFTTGPFTAAATTHTLRFVALNSGGDNDTTAFIDNVRLSLAEAPPLQNGSFETPALPAGYFWYQPPGASWNFTPFSGIINHSPPWGSPVAPDGVQVAMLQSSEGFNSEISQTVSNFAIGARYVVTFSAAQRVLSPPHTNQDFDVLVDNILLGHFAATGWSFENFTTGSFTATATTHTLRFVALNSGGDNDTTAFIDNVRLSLAMPARPVLSISLVPTNRLSPDHIIPYTNDAHTVFLDHFDGTTGASLLAFQEDGTPCDTPKPPATPNYSFIPGPSGLNEALALLPPAGTPPGSYTYLNYPGTDPLSLNDGTLECWIYVTSYGDGWFIHQMQDPGACAGYTFSMTMNATGQIWARAWSAFDMTSGAAVVPTNTWTHLAVSWGSVGAKLFFNGILVGSSTDTGHPAPYFGGRLMVLMGSSSTGGNNQIDELRVSNVQRTNFNLVVAGTLDTKMYTGLTISGSKGATYELQYTTSLPNPNWQPLAGITLPTSPYLYLDTNSPTMGQRFYRALAR